MHEDESSLLDLHINVIQEEPDSGMQAAYRLILPDAVSPSVSEVELLSSHRALSYVPFMREQSNAASSIDQRSYDRLSGMTSFVGKELAVVNGAYHELRDLTDSPTGYYEALRALGAPEVPRVSAKFVVKLREKDLIEKIESKTNIGAMCKGLLIVPAGFSELCKFIISTTLFEYLILLIILANTVTLALEDPQDPHPILQFLGFLFLCAYTIEAGMKIIGLGLVWNAGSYLREGWNVLDLFIVITGWIEHIAEAGYNLRALRTLRVIRPLRSISSIEGLKALIGALFGAMKPLLFAMIVFMFFLCVFAIAGVQLWIGLFKNRCLHIDSGHLGDSLCGSFECPVGYRCVRGLENPNYGVTSFDNILSAFIAVFQSVTLEGWFHIMIDAQNVFGPFVLIFFAPLVFIGAFLMLNFILAVIKYHFTKAMDVMRHSRRKERNLEESLDSSLVRADSELDDDENREEEEVYVTPVIKRPLRTFQHQQPTPAADISPQPEVDTPYERHLSVPSPDSKQVPDFRPTIDVRPSLNLEEINSPVSRRQFVQTAHERVLTFRSSPTMRRTHTKLALARVTLHGGSIKAKRTVAQKLRKTQDYSWVKWVWPEDLPIDSSSLEDVNPRPLGVDRLLRLMKGEREYSFAYTLDEHADELRKDRVSLHRTVMDKYSGTQFEVFMFLTRRYAASKAFHIAELSGRRTVFDSQENDRITLKVQGEWSAFDIDPAAGKHSIEVMKSLSTLRYRLWPSGWCGTFEKARVPFTVLVTHKYFAHTLTLAVVLNTVVLALDHYGISEEMDEMLVLMNVVFTVIFIVEMGLKLIGLGFRTYFKDTMNYLDAAVVIVSSVELVFLSQTSGLTAFRTVRVFRTFRVLRVLRVARLFRYMNSMTAIIQVLGNSIYSFMYLAILLFLFIVIFALLGMQLFGGQFDFEEGTPRANFDSFHSAFVTVFQILSMEDWQSVLYAAMRSPAGEASALYFLAWIFLGNFVLLNLFLAILLDSFDQQEEEEEDELNSEEMTLETDRKQRRNSLFGSNVELKQKKKKEENIEHLKRLHTQGRVSEALNQEPEEDHNPSRSFFIFLPNNPVRVLCHRITNSPMFEKLVLALICLSSAKLVWDTYLLKEDEESTVVVVSQYIDVCVTVLFALEFLLKAINLSFVFEKGAYLREVWNQIDFSIVVISLVELAVQSFNAPFIKVLRLLRTLRPLRIISHNLSMKLVVTALLESMCAIVNVVIVLVIVWLMFAILGVSLFAGKFYTCSHDGLLTQADCEEYGYSWVNADSNFDNVLQALTTLFIVSSLEGWPSIMYQAVDARDERVAPEENYSPIAAYYFIVFILVGSFFFVNLFIGVIFMQFNLAKRNEAAYSLVLNEKQMKWLEIQNLLVKAKPHFEVSTSPTDPLRRACYSLAKNITFEMFILGCILLNMLQMAIAYDGASEDYVLSLELINLVFTVIFILEALIKLTGLGFKGYFHNNWNKFDFFVVITSLLDLAMSTFLGSDQSFLRTAPQLVRVIRVLRVSRLIRIVKTLKPLQDLLMVMAISLPAILNVLSLLMLIFFIYAVLGVFMFYSLDSGEFIDGNTNFSNFGMAMVALLRISTGENWNGIMYDAAEQVGILGSGIYFCSFVVITAFIMLNLFVMVIVQSYQDYKNNPKNPHQVFTADLKNIRRVWRNYSESTQGLAIHSRHLSNFMKDLWILDPKLGINFDYHKQMNELSTMDWFFDEHDRIYFNDFLYAVLKRRYMQKQRATLNDVTKKIVKDRDLSTAKRLSTLREKNKHIDMLDGEQLKKDYFVTMFYERTCFRAWRNWVRRKADRASSEEEFPGCNSFA